MLLWCCDDNSVAVLEVLLPGFNPQTVSIHHHHFLQGFRSFTKTMHISCVGCLYETNLLPSLVTKLLFANLRLSVDAGEMWDVLRLSFCDVRCDACETESNFSGSRFMEMWWMWIWLRVFAFDFISISTSLGSVKKL
jgi:hypothetical protein